MEALAQMFNTKNYIKCGEILKSRKGLQFPYILRCTECNEMFLFLESLIFHLEDCCNKKFKSKKIGQDQNYYSAKKSRVMNEPLICEEETPVKLEKAGDQMKDPLIVVKNEDDNEKLIIKNEPGQFDDKNFKNPTKSESTKYLNQNDYEIFDEENETSLNSQDECDSQSVADQTEILQKPLNSFHITSKFVDDFLKSEENVTATIAAFKDQPQLWNKTMSDYGNKFKRREYMIKIAQDLGINHNINISGSQVSAVIVYIYKQFQDYAQCTQDDNENEKPWYFSQLNFIKPFLENFSLEVLASNQPNLQPDQVIELLETYKSLPHLWNTNLIENHHKNKRHESILEMLKRLETNMNLKINENELEQYLNTIHNNFSRVKQRILNNKKSDTSKELNKNEYYERLMFLYDHAPPFRCSICGYETTTSLHLKKHISTHNGTVPFKCSECNKTFEQAKDYKSHTKSHFSTHEFICTECGKKVANYTNLRFHMRIHTGDKPYCCEICGESFRFFQALSTHRRRHEKRYLHTCKICSKGFYCKAEHDIHMNVHMNKRPYNCDICNKAFVTKHKMNQHKVVHGDVRKHACKLCGKTFKHRTGVNQHMKTHNIATTDDRSVV